MARERHTDGSDPKRRAPEQTPTTGELFFPSDTVIEVLGSTASGKTTLAERLSAHSNLQYVDLDLFEQNPFLARVTEDPKRWAFTAGLYFSYLRSNQVKRVEEARQTGPVVLDQGFHLPLYMYTKNHLRNGNMTQEEWETLEKIHHQLLKDAPVPSISIFLLHSTDTLIARLEQRGREGKRAHETNYTPEFLEKLNIGLNEYLQIVKARPITNSVIVLDQDWKLFSTAGGLQKKLIDYLNKTSA